MSNSDMENSITNYRGQLSSEVRIQLTDLVRVVLLAHVGKRPNIKRLCSIAIELLDNAQRYGSDGHVHFAWELTGDRLVISIENRSSKSDAERLLNSVALVNAMAPRELDDAFRAQLTNGEFGAKGGAGLGLLDIARKAASSIHASIRPTHTADYLCLSQVSTLLN